MAKLVNVTCRRPIRLRNKLVRAIHKEMLEAEEIFECIIQHGVVEEILEDDDRFELLKECDVLVDALAGGFHFFLVGSVP